MVVMGLFGSPPAGWSDRLFQVEHYVGEEVLPVAECFVVVGVFLRLEREFVGVHECLSFLS